MAYPFSFKLPESRLIAHRGLSSLYPENTELSILAAAKAGFEVIEIDVRLTKDCQLVVFHDATGERLANRPDHIDCTTLAELKTWNVASNWPEVEHAEILTFPEALALCHENNLRINVEIKSTPELSMATTMAVIHDIMTCWPGDHSALLVSSFDHEALKQFRKELPDISLGFLVTNPEKATVRLALMTPNASLHVRAGHLMPEDIAELSAEMPILCYTVNEPAQARMLLQSDVAALFTDYPDAMAGFVN